MLVQKWLWVQIFVEANRNSVEAEAARTRGRLKCAHIDTRAHTGGVHGHKGAISFQRQSHYSASPDISAPRRTSRLIFKASSPLHTPPSNDSFIITYYCRPEPGSKLCKCSTFWCGKHLCVLLNGRSSGNLIPPRRQPERTGLLPLE